MWHVIEDLYCISILIMLCSFFLCVLAAILVEETGFAFSCKTQLPLTAHFFPLSFYGYMTVQLYFMSSHWLQRVSSLLHPTEGRQLPSRLQLPIGDVSESKGTARSFYDCGVLCSWKYYRSYRHMVHLHCILYLWTTSRRTQNDHKA